MYTNLKSTMRNEKRINIETKTTSKTTPAFGNSYLRLVARIKDIAPKYSVANTWNIINT